MKILCATDGIDHSKAAVALAANLAARFQAPLALIAVNIRVSEGRGGSQPLWDDQEFSNILKSAEAAARQKGAAEVQIVKLTARDPAAAIIEYADEHGFDHIVVGTPRRGVARFVLGSVAAEIVAKAHCPVTVARQAG
jgi:nucleotide-binding universal stress UspA family protein